MINSDIFTNRQIAILIWTFILTIWSILNRGIRISLLSVIKSFFKIKILSSLFAMIIYISICIAILALIDLWSILLLKDSLIWFCFTAFVITLKAVTSKSQVDFIKKAIVNSIKIVVFLQFIINSYTFPLVIELVLFPIIVMIAMLEVVSSKDVKYITVNKLMNTLLIIIGFIILSNAIYNIYIHLDEFGNYFTLKKFLLPIILTILYAPFLYLVLVISNYEQLFLRLNIGEKINIKVTRYAKRKLLCYCKLNLRRQRIALNMGNYNIMKINSKYDVEEMIKSYEKL